MGATEEADFVVGILVLGISFSCRCVVFSTMLSVVAAVTDAVALVVGSFLLGVRFCGGVVFSTVLPVVVGAEAVALVVVLGVSFCGGGVFSTSTVLPVAVAVAEAVGFMDWVLDLLTVGATLVGG